MNENLLELLACPECGSANLDLHAEDALACLSCDARYCILNGIPRMLPAHLTASLQQKNVHLERLKASMRRENDLPNPGNPEIDRFMWEHHLYNWGKVVIYSDSRAAGIFSSYAEKGGERPVPVSPGKGWWGSWQEPALCGKRERPPGIATPGARGSLHG